MTSIKHASSIACLISCLSIFVFSSGVDAKSAYIGNLTVINSTDGLLVSATLINGFTRKIREAVQSGVPITLQYYIELRERHTIMPDETIVKRVIQREVVYKSLEKKYKFSTILGSKNKTVALKRIRNVRSKMIQLQNILVISTKYLKPKEEYYIRIKGEMSAKNYWFPFNYILFFVDFLNFETPWVESTSIVINQFPIIDEETPGEH